MGGPQISRDYALRPDLVMGPTANVTGSAAVPSSVDVFVNSFRLYTQDVDPGPYRIENLPLVGGNGEATLVTREVSGKESTQTVPFFSSPRLLSPGAFGYSAEIGYRAQTMVWNSFSYAPSLIGTASLRGAIADWATVEAHTEDGAGLVNGGAGWSSAHSAGAWSRRRLPAANMTALGDCRWRWAAQPRSGAL